MVFYGISLSPPQNRPQSLHMGWFCTGVSKSCRERRSLPTRDFLQPSPAKLLRNKWDINEINERPLLRAGKGRGQRNQPDVSQLMPDNGYSKHPSFWDSGEGCAALQGEGGCRPFAAIPAPSPALQLHSMLNPLLPFLRSAAFLPYFPLGLQFFPVSHRQYIKHILLKFFQQKLHWNNF